MQDVKDPLGLLKEDYEERERKFRRLEKHRLLRANPPGKTCAAKMARASAGAINPSKFSSECEPCLRQETNNANLPVPIPPFHWRLD